MYLGELPLNPYNERINPRQSIINPKKTAANLNRILTRSNIHRSIYFIPRIIPNETANIKRFNKNVSMDPLFLFNIRSYFRYVYRGGY